MYESSLSARLPFSGSFCKDSVIWLAMQWSIRNIIQQASSQYLHTKTKLPCAPQIFLSDGPAPIKLDSWAPIVMHVAQGPASTIPVLGDPMVTSFAVLCFLPWIILKYAVPTTQIASEKKKANWRAYWSVTPCSVEDDILASLFAFPSKSPWTSTAMAG